MADRVQWSGSDRPGDSALARGSVSHRMLAVMARQQRTRSSDLDQLLVWAAATMAVCVGAWWTASAALAGDGAAMVLRFGLSVLFGVYYWLIGAFVRGQSA